MHHSHTHQHQVQYHPHTPRHLHKIIPRSLDDTGFDSTSVPASPPDQSANSNNNVGGLSPSAVDALIALLVLILVSIVGVGSLLLIKHRKNAHSRSRENSISKDSRRRSSSSSSKRSKGELPLYTDVMHEKHGSQLRDGSIDNKRSTVTISATNGRLQKESTYYLNDHQRDSYRSDSPPPAGVPEIRITFPEEEDDQGQPISGRVVVVRISESGGIGLEPLDEKKDIEMHADGYEKRDFERDGLPAYEQNRLESLDLDRIGGLKEREGV
ncbi:hypothetical protein KEM54_006442 [Ascosphaera aggregata]|nr:hypothetical protein KEM54_006442 [Ascosphaera aggregata]